MTKECNLSERIEQLKVELKDNAKLNDTQIDGIIRLISFMDGEFITKLREFLLDIESSYVYIDDLNEAIDDFVGKKFQLQTNKVKK